MPLRAWGCAAAMLCSTSCGAAPEAPAVPAAPIAAPTEGGDMVVEVAGTAELAKAMQAWSDLRYSESRSGTLEVRLAAGSYTGSLALADDRAKADIHVRLIGAPGAVFRGGQITLAGPTVHVEGITLIDTMLDVGAWTRIALDRVAVLSTQPAAGAHPGSQSVPAGLAVHALRGTPTVAIQRSWFLAERREAAAGIQLDLRKGTFAGFTITDSVFLGSAGRSLVGQADVDVRVAGSVVEGLPWALDLGRVHFERCDLVAPTPGSLGFTPASVSGTVYGAPGPVTDGVTWAAPVSTAEAVEAAWARALAGEPPDVDAVQARLR